MFSLLLVREHLTFEFIPRRTSTLLTDMYGFQLPALINANFPVLGDKQGIMGHRSVEMDILTLYVLNFSEET